MKIRVPSLANNAFRSLFHVPGIFVAQSGKRSGRFRTRCSGRAWASAARWPAAQAPRRACRESPWPPWTSRSSAGIVAGPLQGRKQRWDILWVVTTVTRGRGPEDGHEYLLSPSDAALAGTLRTRQSNTENGVANSRWVATSTLKEEVAGHNRVERAARYRPTASLPIPRSAV